jgi:hypothetical protein
MEQPILSDKNQFPSEEIIFSHIGNAKVLWIALFGYIHAERPDFSEEWRYYTDVGKGSWLLKVSRKKKTIFWLSILEGSFRITFYFTGKAEKAIMESSISDVLKEQFMDCKKKKNKFWGLTIYYKEKKDIEDAKTLIGIKISMK